MVRASSKGNYVSVTARLYMASSEEVLAIYHAAGRVDGVISL
jgi:putative lipoic acid-binding regulatory protein